MKCSSTANSITYGVPLTKTVKSPTSICKIEVTALPLPLSGF
jgi:hypothetical protein